MFGNELPQERHFRFPEFISGVVIGDGAIDQEEKSGHPPETEIVAAPLLDRFDCIVKRHFTLPCE